MRRAFVPLCAICGLALMCSSAGARVLRVGTYRGIHGQYSSVSAAAGAARSGDWILVAPGDYKTASHRAPADAADTPAGVLITTPNLHLRGLNRNTVVLDGTKPGSPRCSAAQPDQNFGPAASGGPQGLNGVLVWKADNVSVENMTACNFLNGSGSAGNEFWWNGGHGSGTIGGHGFSGNYLTATSTYYDPANKGSAAGYGIFSSEWSGGSWNHTYVSNFNDSGYYIGACQQVCNQTLTDGWSEFNALGYSGTNSGGVVVIKNSQFDNNEDGFDTNSQNNDDFPSPQDGACPNNGVSPITHTHSCWVFMNNYVHDNNNPYVPSAGAAAAGPVGTGMSLSGARNDTVMNNRFVNNGSWGTIFVPYPDTETPPPDAPNCAGGTSGTFLGITVSCLYDDWGNALINNTYTNNGYFGNPTNGDLAESTLTPGHPINCYRGNTDASGTVTTSPPGLQTTNASCGQTAVAPDPNPTFVFEALCDSQFFGSSTNSLNLGNSFGCPPNANYPRSNGKVIMHPLPAHLATMPNPCAGVPTNPWCPTRAPRRPTTSHRPPPPRRSSGSGAVHFTG